MVRDVTRAGATARDHWLRTSALLVCLSSLFTSGCQIEPTTVTGRVTLDGRPISIKRGMQGTVVFQPAAADGKRLTGLIDSSGRYELATGSSTLVTPSVYWVAVSVVEAIPPSREHPEPKGRRITPGKYASATDSGIRIEVVPGPNEVDLELVSDAAETESAGSAEIPTSPQTSGKVPAENNATKP